MFNPKFIEDWLERFEKQERRRLTNATVLNNQVNPAYEVKWLQGYITAKQETLEATVDVLPLIFQHEFERFKEILEEWLRLSFQR